MAGLGHVGEIRKVCRKIFYMLELCVLAVEPIMLYDFARIS